jgi:nucleoside-diphosphate-sugar epimerase
MEPRRPVWFVTGASGFVGRRFTETAAARPAGPTLRLLVHRTPVAPPPGRVELVPGSLDADAGLIAGARGADAVVHFAGTTHTEHEEEYHRVNGGGTERLVRAAAAAGVGRFIHISSRAIGPDCGAYARSKRHAEEAVQAGGLPHTILRFAEVYGPEAREGLNALIRLVRVSPVVPYPAGPFALAPLFLDDAVDVVCRALDASEASNRVYTVAGPGSYGFRDLVRVIARTFGLHRLAVPVPLAGLAAAGRAAGLLGRPIVHADQIARLRCPKDADITNVRRDLGFAPVGFAEGLLDMRMRSGPGV